MSDISPTLDRTNRPGFPITEPLRRPLTPSFGPPARPRKGRLSMLFEAFENGALDHRSVVTISGHAVSGIRLRAAAAAVSAEIGRVNVVAVHATPTIETMVAIV